MRVLLNFIVLSFSVFSVAAPKLSEIPAYSQNNRLWGIGSLKNKYIVVRHGQAAINVPPHFCTTRQADETMVSDLTETGREQATQAGVNLSQQEIQAEDVIILSSPFKRALQTARIIGDRLNVRADIHEALRERYLGVHDGLPVTQERLDQIEGVDHVDPWHVNGNVESVMATMERLTGLVKELEELYSGKTIILVSHWHPVSILMNAFEGHPPGKNRVIQNAVPYEITLHPSVAKGRIAAPRRIIFVRHAESETNELWQAGRIEEAIQILDPGLSDLGVQQALQTRSRVAERAVDMIAVSPMTRTLQTAHLIFGHRQVPMIALPDIVESAYGQVFGSPGCNGREKNVLEKEFPRVNFDSLGPTWTGLYTGEGESEPTNRMKRFKEWLRVQDVDSVAVVSHGTFLKELLGLKKGPGNCEVIEAYFDADGELRTET